jgi:cytidylate kinase
VSDAGRRVVAIDGPSGSGKSTVARGVAHELGLEVLDTGAMYRAVTLAALDARTDLTDGAALAEVARRAEISLTERVVLDGTDVTAKIRGPDVTGAVSAVSGHPAVRAVLVQRQRAWVAAHGGGVVEGRDIGTVVFPDAAVKVFLTADAGERARRRQQDEAAAERAVEIDVLADDLARRDRADATLGRATSAADAAPDAIVVDSTQRGVDDVVADVVARFRAATR